MTLIPPHTNPLAIAKESMEMGKKSDERAFKLMAMAMMGMAGLGATLHALHMLWRDFAGTRGEREHGRGNRQPEHATPEAAEMPLPERDGGSTRKWTQDEHIGRKQQPRADYRDRQPEHSHGRQR